MLRNKFVAPVLAGVLAFVGTGLATTDARAAVSTPSCVRAPDGVLRLNTPGVVDNRVVSVRTERKFWDRTGRNTWTSKQALSQFDDGRYVHVVVKDRDDRWSGWVQCVRSGS